MIGSVAKRDWLHLGFLDCFIESPCASNCRRVAVLLGRTLQQSLSRAISSQSPCLSSFAAALHARAWVTKAVNAAHGLRSFERGRIRIGPLSRQPPTRAPLLKRTAPPRGAVDRTSRWPIPTGKKNKRRCRQSSFAAALHARGRPERHC